MSQDILCDILDNPKTKSHIRAMYRIVTVGLHESAFAVYNAGETEDGKQFVVSDLAVPEIGPGDFFEVARRSRRLSTDDVYPLIRYPDDEIAVRNAALGQPTRYGEYVLSPYEHLDPKIQTRVERIMGNLSYSLGERVHTANQLIHSAESRLEANRCTRDDIELVAHNHPQLPTIHRRPEHLVQPSLTDITTHLELKRYNPSHVEMVVGSDRENHAALLYKALVDAPQLADYGEKLGTEPTNQLVVAGFAVATLRLRSNGSIYKSSLPDLKAFTAATAAK